MPDTFQGNLFFTRKIEMSEMQTACMPHGPQRVKFREESPMQKFVFRFDWHSVDC